MLEILKIIGTSLISLVVLFLLTKMMGNKQVSQLNMFDYIIGITIGSIAAEFATDLETTTEPLTAMIVYGIVAYAVSVVTSRSLKLRKIVVGRSLILMDNGIIYRENLKKARIDISDFMTQCRYAGYFDLNQIQTAIFEYNGNLSILPVSSIRPLEPLDIKIEPEQEYIQTAVILDGHINKWNLRITGNDNIWLDTELKKQGHHNEKEILLALCDNNNNLTIFPIDVKNNQSDIFE